MLPIISRRTRIISEYVRAPTKSVTASFGDTVRFLPRISSASLTNKFDGVFTVSRVISRTIYELVNDRGESVGRADTKDLKPYLEAAASE